MSTENGFDGLEFTDAQLPFLSDHEVLVKVHAVSLNFRDLMIPKVHSYLASLLPTNNPGRLPIST